MPHPALRATFSPQTGKELTADGHEIDASALQAAQG
jgi:hypothetical protein